MSETRIVQLEPGWLAQLTGEFERPYMEQLRQFLVEEKSKGFNEQVALSALSPEGDGEAEPAAAEHAEETTKQTTEHAEHGEAASNEAAFARPCSSACAPCA